MRPGPIHYLKPDSLQQALAAMAAGAIPLAGGQSLLQAMRLRIAEPRALVDISGIGELEAAIRRDNDTLVIGALTTHRELLEDSSIGAEFPWLARAARALGDVQVRNRGTVLGNVCWADPRANMAIALLASDARITVAGGAGRDAVPITAFFSAYRQNCLGHALATAITLPRDPNARGSYLEFSRQRQDLALANVCVVHSERGAAVAIGGIGQVPVRLVALENMLDERGFDHDVAQPDIVRMLEDLALEPILDHFGSPQYKRDVAATLVKRAIANCAGGGDHV